VRPEQGIYGLAPAAAAGVPSVIMLEPLGGTSVLTETEPPAPIDQFGLTFSPTLLVAHVGDTTVFSNSESAVAHHLRIRALINQVDILDGVPPGAYTVQLWTADGGFHDARSIEVTVGSTGIDLTTPG